MAELRELDEQEYGLLLEAVTENQKGDDPDNMKWREEMRAYEEPTCS